MKALWVSGLSALVLTLGSVPASAQAVIGAKSGVVNYIEGTVYLGDKLLEIQPAQFPDIKENTVLRTDEGRAEVLLPPGVVMRLGEKTSFRMISNRLIDTRIELLSGSAVIEADEIGKDTHVTVVAQNATVSLSKAGLYRFDMQPAQVKVFKGSADVQIGSDTVEVSGGKMMQLAGALAVAEKFNTDDTDSLDHWSRRRGEMMAMSNVSAANRARTSGWQMDPCSNVYGNSLGSWGYNPYYGLGTYIPCSGSIYSPYGFQFWSPMAVYRAYYAPRPVFNPGFGGGGRNPAYPTMVRTSSGYSGTMSSVASAPSAPAAASSAGSVAASSGGGASVGHGSGGGGGRGH
jgi:FecR protein